MEYCLFLCFVALTAAAVSAQTYPLVLVNGALGGSVEFNLHITIPPNRAITWRADGGAVYIARILNNNNPTYNQSYGDRCELFPNGTLRLDNLTRGDQRLYAVTIENQVEFTNQYVSYQLDVYAFLNAPQLRVNSSSTNFINGTNLTLQCDAGSQNVTTYTFYRDQKPICSEPHVTCKGSVLEFTPITENDSGSYTCTIQNPVSTSISNSVNLTVIAPVSSVALTSNTSGLLWPGIDSVSLHCSARGTDVSYSWSLNEAELPMEPRYQLNQDKSVLIISPVSSKDNGSFTCTASNIINNETSNGIVFNLGFPPSAVTLTSNTSEVLWVGRDSVCLHCSADGSALDFSWSLDGKPVSNNTQYYITPSDSLPYSNLTISPVSKEDTGPFICTAKNLLNSTNSNEKMLDLNWYPEGNITCDAKAIKDGFSFVCSWADGRPPANVTMMLNSTSETLPNNVTRNLDVNALIKGSNLTCSGDQLGRKSMCVLTLDPPHSSQHDNNTITNTPDGQKAVLKVKLDSSKKEMAMVLPVTFTWYRYNPDKTEITNGGGFTVEDTSDSSILSILTVTQAYAGKYECVARNLVGSEIFIFNVNVTAKPNPPANGLDGGAIAGIVIGVLAVLVIIGIIIFFVLKKN